MHENILDARIVGVMDLFFGDSGKGHIVDWLVWYMKEIGRPFDMVIRPTSSHNAGHHIIRKEGEFSLHVIPSAILFPEVIKLCGNGMALHPVWLADEIKDLEKRGIDLSRFYVSDDAIMILPWYQKYEQLREFRLKQTGKHIGTTGKAVGPTYGRFHERSAIKMGMLRRPKDFRKALMNIASDEDDVLSACGIAPTDFVKVADEYLEAAECILPRLINSFEIIDDALFRGKRFLLEGAQGGGLDINFGTYPFVTGTNTGRAGLMAGSGLSHIDHLIGVTKMYATRVGEGPYPTEIKDPAFAEMLRALGKEYGSTTGRPRRVGWRDLAYERYVVRRNKIDSVIVTKVDILHGMPELFVGIGYKDNVYPSKIDFDTEPILQRISSYKNPENLNQYSDLDLQCKYNLAFCKNFIEVPLFAVSVGPDREHVLLAE